MEQSNIVATVTAPNPAFEIERDALAKALAFMAKHIVERRNTIPILSNVEILAAGNTIRIRACDWDMMATITLPATVDRAGVTTLSAFTLADTLKKAGKAPYFKMDANGDGKARIAVGRTIQNLNTLSADDFPTIKPVENGRAWRAPCAELLADWQLVTPAISTEETRYYLNGICVDPTGEMLTYAATDGHRLSTVKRPNPIGGTDAYQIIIYRKAVAAIMATLKGMEGECELSDCKTRIAFTAGNVEIVAKLIDGTFPDYTRVIPPACGDVHILEATGAELATHCKAASGKPACLHMELGASGSRVGQSGDEGRWAQPLVATYQGDGCSIGFNARYLEQFAKLAPSLRMAFEDFNAPTRITSPDLPQWEAMIMPMRLRGALPAESVVEFAPVMAAPGHAADLFGVETSRNETSRHGNVMQSIGIRPGPRAATVNECVAYMTDYARRLGIEFDHVTGGTCSSITLRDADGNELQVFNMPHAGTATVVTVETMGDEGNWSAPRPCLNGKGEIAAPVQRKERKAKAPKVKADSVTSEVVERGGLHYQINRGSFGTSIWHNPHDLDGVAQPAIVIGKPAHGRTDADIEAIIAAHHAPIAVAQDPAPLPVESDAPADLCNGPMFKGWPWDEVFADIARHDFPTRIECIDGTYSIVNTWTRKGGLQRTRIPVRHIERARELFEAQAARFAAANPVAGISPSEAPAALSDENGPSVSGEPEIAPATPVAPEIDGNVAAPVPAMASDDPMAAIMARLEAIEARLSGPAMCTDENGGNAPVAEKETAEMREVGAPLVHTPIGATDTPIAAMKRTAARERMIRRYLAMRAERANAKLQASDDAKLINVLWESERRIHEREAHQRQMRRKLAATAWKQRDAIRKLLTSCEQSARDYLDMRKHRDDLEGSLLRERAKRAQSVERSRANHRLARRAIASKGELLTEALKLRTEVGELRGRCQRAESELAVAKASPTYMGADGKEFADARAMAMQRANEAVDRAERIAERLATAEATVKRQAGAIDAMEGKFMEMTGRALRAETALQAIEGRIARDGQPYSMAAPTVRFRQAA